MEKQMLEKLEKVVGQVSEELGINIAQPDCKKPVAMTEFVGTAMGDTIGLVIASVDSSLTEPMKLGRFKSIGVIGARVGAGPQIMAVDEAVKATNTEIVSVELPRDTKGGAGHGSLIYIGADDVSDARRAVEIALEVLPKYFGDVYANEAGHLEFQYTARASYCLEKTFNTPLGKSFGLVCAGPAAIGTILADTAVKAANVDVVSYSSPSCGTSYSNEVILTFSGDSGAVRQAVRAARDAGIQLLGALGSQPKTDTKPYI